MERHITSKPRHFTPFRSAAEEVATSKAGQQWDNEGGHVPALSGYIVWTPDDALAYKVILDHDVGPDTEHPWGTIEQCQAFIRRNTRYGPSQEHDGVGL